MAMPLNRMAAERGMRLERVSEAERQQVRQQVAQLHQLREQRVQQEREGARARSAGGAAASRPRPMNLPHSPIAAHPAAAHATAAHAAAAQHAAPHGAEAAHAGAAHAAGARSEAARQGQAAHATGAAGRQGATSRTAPRAGAAARRPAPRETPRSAATQRGRADPPKRKNAGDPNNEYVSRATAMSCACREPFPPGAARGACGQQVVPADGGRSVCNLSRIVSPGRPGSAAEAANHTVTAVAISRPARSPTRKEEASGC